MEEWWSVVQCLCGAFYSGNKQNRQHSRNIHEMETVHAFFVTHDSIRAECEVCRRVRMEGWQIMESERCYAFCERSWMGQCILNSVFFTARNGNSAFNTCRMRSVQTSKDGRLTNNGKWAVLCVLRTILNGAMYSKQCILYSQEWKQCIQYVQNAKCADE